MCHYSYGSGGHCDGGCRGQGRGHGVTADTDLKVDLLVAKVKVTNLQNCIVTCNINNNCIP